MYEELNKFNNIEDILKDNSAVILYQNKPRRGHWVCVLRYMNKERPTIEFFDSYGMFPDDEKKHINKSFLNATDQRYNKLTELLLNATDRYDIQYNNYKLQKKGSSVATCGRHVIARIMLNGFNIDEYNRFIKSFTKHGLSPDDVVTMISEMR